MKNEEFVSPAKVSKEIAGVFRSLGLKRNATTKANVNYFFVSVVFCGLLIYLLGLSAEVIIACLFLQSIYFFNKSVSIAMFKVVLTFLIITILAMVSFYLLVERTGLQSDFASYVKTKVLREGLRLNNPSVDIEARLKSLIHQKGEVLLDSNYNDFDGLLDAQDSIQRMKAKLVKAMEDTDSMDRKDNNLSVDAITHIAAHPAVVDLDTVSQFKIGDSLYYKFVLYPGQITSKLRLVDSTGMQYGWNLNAKPIIVINNGKETYYSSSGLVNVWSENIVLKGPKDGPVSVKIIIFPYFRGIDVQPKPGQKVESNPAPLISA